MNISYLITCSNETKTLRNLLSRINDGKDPTDEIVIVLDSDCIHNKKTKQILIDRFGGYLEHSLNNNYSEHKNWGAKQCDREWIFQIDGDENPTEILLNNIKSIIESNPDVESFWIPRINDFKGVTEQHAKQWGWKLSPSTSIVHEKIINIYSEEYKFLKTNGYIISETTEEYVDIDKHTSFSTTIKHKAVLVNAYDPQCRLFVNKPEIKWVGRLHERIEGNKNYVYLPFDEDLALYHDKTIEKQIETNLRYNQKFTEKENRGFNLPKS